MVFWDQIFAELGKEYPEVETHSYLVDAASMFMVKDPKWYQVVVCSNLFGDILTDLGAAFQAAWALLPGQTSILKGLSIHVDAIHEAAPEYAGTGKANPLASIWSASQMLDFFGHPEWGRRLLAIIEAMLVEKTILTPDMGGTATTSEVGDEVVKRIEEA